MDALSGKDLLDAVSRETYEKLQVYHGLLLKWQRVKNLISRNSTDDIWERHFRDSAQLLEEGSDGDVWADLGSGGGFPGLVIAILLLEFRPTATVHLIDSDHRKCAFLREVSRETGARTVVHCARIEDVIPDLDDIHIVSARALASLNKLIEFSMPLLEKGAKGLFLKGQDVERELLEMPKYSMLDVRLKKSKTDPDGRIVIVKHC